MPDIFDEVEEELRAEKTRQFLTRYAGLILGAVVLVVVAVAGWQVWRWHQERQDQQAAAIYMQAMIQADQPAGQQAALTAFSQLAEHAPEGYRTLSRLRAAALEANAGHVPQALDLWNQVAADSSADPLLRDLATLLWAQHQLDTGDPGMLEARLRPLTELANPWRNLAQEQLALLDVRRGRTEQAKQELSSLANNPGVPTGIRERATALLARLAG